MLEPNLKSNEEEADTLIKDLEAEVEDSVTLKTKNGDLKHKRLTLETEKEKLLIVTKRISQDLDHMAQSIDST